MGLTGTCHPAIRSKPFKGGTNRINREKRIEKHFLFVLVIQFSLKEVTFLTKGIAFLLGPWRPAGTGNHPEMLRDKGDGL